jgi:hypothetical protein
MPAGGYCRRLLPAVIAGGYRRRLSPAVVAGAAGWKAGARALGGSAAHTTATARDLLPVEVHRDGDANLRVSRLSKFAPAARQRAWRNQGLGSLGGLVSAPR